MTDAEINLAIANIEHPDDEFEIQAHCSDVFSEHWADTFNYCNDWADIGPIIEREKIDLTAIEDGWEANGYFYVISALAKTPTKAAALCYLKMNGG